MFSIQNLNRLNYKVISDFKRDHSIGWLQLAAVSFSVSLFTANCMVELNYKYTHTHTHTYIYIFYLRKFGTASVV
jgi:hypothetical protein